MFQFSNLNLYRAKHPRLIAGACFIICATLLAGLTAQAAEKIDLSTPEGAFAAWRKDTCSLIDEKPVIYTWQGALYAFRQGEPDKKLFNLEGMNIRQCDTVDGGKKGKGVKIVSREIMLYLDPKTNKRLDKWLNPWLGREVQVLHVANDPVNFGTLFPRKETGEPAFSWPTKVTEDSWYNLLTVPLFYHNVLQGDYQRYVGGAYHAVEMFSSFGALDDLLDKKTDTTMVRGGGWSRLSAYLPWMEMQGREGTLYAHAVSYKVEKFDDLSDVLKTYINEVAPKYKMPPPMDDTRKNETSWTVFGKQVEGEKLKRGGH